MQYYPRTSSLTALALLASATFCHADTWTGTTSDLWTEPTNWQDGTAPTATDAIVFDVSSTANPLTKLEAPFAVTGISVIAPGANISVASGAAGTLAIGAGGIDLSAATKDLTFSFTANNVVSFAADQTFNVATGRTLTFGGTASNRLFPLGSHTFTKSGAGSLVINPGLSLSDGIFDLQAGGITVASGSSMNTTSPNTVSYKVATGTTLTLKNDSGSLTCASPIEVNGGTVTIGGGASHAISGPITGTGGIFSTLIGSTGTVTKTISGAFTGTGTFDLRNQITSGTNHALILSGNNSGFTGTFNVNGTTGSRAVRLTTATAGSAGAVWNVAAANILQVANVAVNLGDLTGAGTVTTNTGAGSITLGALNHTSTFSGIISGATTVTKVGTGKLTLSGANTYTGETVVNEGTLSLSAATLNDASIVRIAATGTLELTHTTTDSVKELYLDGNPAALGVWGPTGSGAPHTSDRFTGTGFLQVGTAYQIWSTQKLLTVGVNDAKDQDPDNDGIPNLIEFAFDTDPLSPILEHKIVTKMVTIGTDQVLTLTLPIRTGIAFSGTTERVSALTDGVVYRIQADDDLSGWEGMVSEITGTDATTIQQGLTLPLPLTPGWSYRTFRTSNPVSASPKNFLRAKAGES